MWLLLLAGGGYLLTRSMTQGAGATQPNGGSAATATPTQSDDLSFGDVVGVVTSVLDHGSLGGDNGGRPPEPSTSLPAGLYWAWDADHKTWTPAGTRTPTVSTTAQPAAEAQPSGFPPPAAAVPPPSTKTVVATPPAGTYATQGLIKQAGSGGNPVVRGIPILGHTPSGFPILGGSAVGK